MNWKQLGKFPSCTPAGSPKASGETYELDTRNIGTNQPGYVPIPNDPVRLDKNRSVQSGSTGEDRLDRSSPPSSESIPKAQEFKCPRCRREKIVGLNGSRRWCLNCGAEWATAAAFLQEVNRQPAQPQPSRRAIIQHRFERLLARLDDHQIDELAVWLDDLERKLNGTDTGLGGLAPGPINLPDLITTHEICRN